MSDWRLYYPFRGRRTCMRAATLEELSERWRTRVDIHRRPALVHVWSEGLPVGQMNHQGELWEGGWRRYPNELSTNTPAEG